MRFAITRPSSGFSGEVSHSASALRRCGTNRTSFGSTIGGPGLQRGKEARLHLRALVLEIAAQQDVGVGNDVVVRQNVGRGASLGRPQICLAELLQERGALWIHAAARRRRRRIGFDTPSVGLRLPAASSATAAPAAASGARRHLLQHLRLVQQRKVARRGLHVQQAAQRDLALPLPAKSAVMR